MKKNNNLLEDIIKFFKRRKMDSCVKTLIEIKKDSTMGYELILFPDSQDYMTKKWFDKEAILALGQEDKYGSAAYFIPKNRL